MEPILFVPENDHVVWENVTRELIAWAHKTRRGHTDGAWIKCSNCWEKKFPGDEVLVVYETRGEVVYKNVYCSVLCQRQYRLKILAKKQRWENK